MPSLPRRLPIHIACAAIIAAAVAAGTGCGRTDEEKVRDTVEKYVEAQKDKDYSEICDLFDPAFRREQGLQKNCAQTLASQDAAQEIGDSSITDVKVRHGKATVDLDVSQGGEGPSRRTISLVRRDGTWKVNGTT